MDGVVMKSGSCQGATSWVGKAATKEFIIGTMQGHRFLVYLRNYFGGNRMIMSVQDCVDTFLLTDAQGGPVTISFDQGATWNPTRDVIGGVRLFVAGSECTAPAASAVILPIGAYQVLARMTDTTQTVTRRAAGDISIVQAP